MTNPNGDPFAGRGDRNPAFSWKDVQPGTTIRFNVTDWPTTAQARDYDDKTSLVYWDKNRKGKKTTVPNDEPVMNAIIPATVDGEPTSLFAVIYGESLYFAISEAQQAAGQHIAPGSTLDVTLTARTPDPDNPHRQPRKDFTATYWPPAAFAAEPATPAAAPPAAGAAAPQAASVATVTKGLTAEQYAALAAANVDMTPFHVQV